MKPSCTMEYVTTDFLGKCKTSFKLSINMSPMTYSFEHNFFYLHDIIKLFYIRTLIAKSNKRKCLGNCYQFRIENKYLPNYKETFFHRNQSKTRIKCSN